VGGREKLIIIDLLPSKSRCCNVFRQEQTWRDILFAVNRSFMAEIASMEIKGERRIYVEHC